MIYDMVWYDMIRYDMVWYMIRYVMIYDIVCYDMIYDMIWYGIIWYMICLFTAIVLPPGGSGTVHIYTQTIQRTTQLTTNWEECRPCPVFAGYTLAFALQLRKKHGKTSVRVAEECQLALVPAGCFQSIRFKRV
jgi:hypothetical protein